MPPQDSSKTSVFPTPPTMEEVPAPVGGIYSPVKNTPSNPLPANPSPTIPPAPVLEPNPTVQPTPINQGTMSTVAPPPPKKAFPKKILFIFLGLVVVVVLVFIIKSLLGKSAKPQTTEITWWGLWEDETIIAPLIEEYQTANPNVKITYVKNSPQDYRERLTNALAKGTGPDIFRFHNTWVPMFSSELDNVPASVIGGGEYAQTFYPVIASDLTSGTGLVGVPLGYDALTLFINEDIFAQAGITPPTTWVEMR
jgi:multiple sugar transport system substrate-binding protein